MPAAPDHDPLELIRKLAAEVRRRTGEFDTIFDLLPVGIGISEDPECRHIRVNRAFAELLGISARQNASLSAPEDERPAFRILKDGKELTSEELPMQHAARHGAEVRAFEVDVVHPDGRKVSLYEYAAPLYDEHGRVRGAIGAFVDISERRRVEQELRFLSEASGVLASSLEYESTLKALARLAVPVFGEYCAVDVQRDDGGFTRVEFVVADAARAEIAEALKQYPPVLTVNSPAARAIRTGEVEIADECTPDILARSAQNPRHLDLLLRFGVTSYMMVPLRARGRTLGLVTVGSFSGRRYVAHDIALANDVAGRAALALDNALLYRHAQEANRLKDEFLATLSHELRTPLNALLGWTQLLKGATLDETSRKRALESIERNAQAQTVLINDILDVSRVISGKLRLDEKPVDISSVVLAAADAVRPAVRARDIELNVSLAPFASEIVGDADRLQQIVWNLLSNAVKFTPPGGRIDLAVEEMGGAIQICVTDTGAGIDPVFLPYVFERFRQGDSSTTRTQSGLGLGLAIVRHLVDLHGGTVSAESAGLEKGSRFVVTLPARPGVVAQPPAQSGEAAAKLQPALAGVRVLAVDDDQDSRELILLTMRAAGAEVMVVSSAVSALDVLPTFAPDIVVSDIAMPGFDGFALMKEIASRSAHPPPVIGLSAYASATDERHALEAGFADYLGKPADARRLVDTISSVVNRVRQ